MSKLDDNEGSWLKDRRLPLTLEGPRLAALRLVPGVADAVPAGRFLRLRYDLRRVTFRELQPHLPTADDQPGAGIGWHCRSTLWSLSEDIQIETKRQRDLDWDTLVRDVHLSQYHHRRHGRRDERPQHWRKYHAS